MHEILNNPVFSMYAIASLVLGLKMLTLGGATGIVRVLRKQYISPEDYPALGGEPKDQPDEFIERLRRAHQNDLENIGPFFVIGALFALSGPSESTAWWLFTIFTVGRLTYTVVYAAGLQPWRTIVFEVANVANFTMAIMALLAIL